MKIQLDTTAKTIKVESAVNFGELVEVLEKMLPDGEWKSFNLQANTVIQQWGNPIIIRERAYPYVWPWRTGPYFGEIMCGSTSQTTNYTDAIGRRQKPMLNAGVFNVEV